MCTMKSICRQELLERTALCVKSNWHNFKGLGYSVCNLKKKICEVELWKLSLHLTAAGVSGQSCVTSCASWEEASIRDGLSLHVSPSPGSGLGARAAGVTAFPQASGRAEMRAISQLPNIGLDLASQGHADQRDLKWQRDLKSHQLMSVGSIKLMRLFRPRAAFL